MPLGAPSSWDLPYLNLVIAGETSLLPLEVLKCLKEIERELGRDFEALRWAPRIIDLDVIAWDEKIIVEETLKIPHPELMNRPFFISLMASLAPHWRYPVSGFPYSHMTLSEILHKHVKPDLGISGCFMASPQIMGIVNVTPDSFSDGNKYIDAEKAVEKIYQLAAQGSAVIDIGAESTRRNSNCISVKEEWDRLEPVFNLLKRDFYSLLARPQISLDSYHPEVIEKAIKNYSVDWVNDDSGGEAENLLKMISPTNCRIVINHSLSIPPSAMCVLPFDVAPILYLKNWAERKVKQLHQFGISKDRIILDPGIGFGKTPYQNLSILSEIDVLKEIGCEILVGHSRKSFLKLIPKAADRDFETVGESIHLVKKGVDYLRVHNVEAHQQALTAFSLLQGSFHDC